MNTSERWPALRYEEWKDTYATLHMWSQIVGKIALASVPPLNHSWAIAFRVTPRGLSTRRLFHGNRAFAMEFDFIDHQLVIRVSDGTDRMLRLEPKTVADFYQELMTLLREMGLEVPIWTMPVEIASPVPFESDTTHRTYDPVFANRFWRILGQIDDVFTRSQTAFVGKSSPSHFFWGGFDLALTRFSGRPAPPREGPAFMREAYSHEVISHGFWPGSAPVLESAFYAYAVPEPLGFKELKAQPDAAFYHRDLGEFILPYESVRTARSPEASIRAFVESTYEGAADLAGWDRRSLERAPAAADRT
jgi:Family of unknown function (DUF5996)